MIQNFGLNDVMSYKMLLWLGIWAGVGLSLGFAQTNPVEPVIKTPAPVELWLKFEPTSNFSPGKDTSTKIVCYALNKTQEAIDVNTVLGRSGLTLSGQGTKLRFSMQLQAKNADTEEKMLTLPPNDTQVVFQARLQDLFDAELKPRANWYWDWRAETRAPVSPFYVEDTKANEAQFWFTLRIKGRNYASLKEKLSIMPTK